MQLERILAWLPLAMLFAMMLAGRLRALAMRRRGVRAIIVDLRRPIRERLYDTLMIGVAILWIYLLVAAAWPLSLAWLPGWLTAKIVDSRAVKLVGAALTLAAPVLYAAALHSMGTSWRIGIDQQKPGPLVTTGVFAWMRNPIYTAFDLAFLGPFLIHGRLIFLLVGAVLMLLIHGIIRREERFIAERFGDAFHAYRARVGRYSPWV
ncbi:MAG: isoprenylcysteine carboxylmethyltransferase family protein [Pirellulales bacterium]